MFSTFERQKSSEDNEALDKVSACQLLLIVVKYRWSGSAAKERGLFLLLRICRRHQRLRMYLIIQVF